MFEKRLRGKPDDRQGGDAARIKRSARWPPSRAHLEWLVEEAII